MNDKEKLMEEITNRIVPRALDLLTSMREERADDAHYIDKVVDYAAVIALADALRHSIRGTALFAVVMDAANVVSASLRAGLDEREGRGGGPAA